MEGAQVSLESDELPNTRKMMLTSIDRIIARARQITSGPQRSHSLFHVTLISLSVDRCGQILEGLP
jgi:hypothetical protein